MSSWHTTPSILRRAVFSCWLRSPLLNPVKTALQYNLKKNCFIYHKFCKIYNFNTFSYKYNFLDYFQYMSIQYQIQYNKVFSQNNINRNKVYPSKWISYPEKKILNRTTYNVYSSQILLSNVFLVSKSISPIVKKMSQLFTTKTI